QGALAALRDAPEQGAGGLLVLETAGCEHGGAQRERVARGALQRGLGQRQCLGPLTGPQGVLGLLDLARAGLARAGLACAGLASSDLARDDAGRVGAAGAGWPGAAREGAGADVDVVGLALGADLAAVVAAQLLGVARGAVGVVQ